MIADAPCFVRSIYLSSVGQTPIYMRPTTMIFAVLLLTGVVFCAFGDTGEASKTTKRLVPPTAYVSFPEMVQVDTVYIYPSAIAFLPRGKAKPHTAFAAELSNLEGGSPYSRKVSCTYDADDSTYWIHLPEDVPSTLSIDIVLNKQRAMARSGQ